MEDKNREWKVRPLENHSNERVLSLSTETGLSPLTTMLCLQRGLDSREAIHHFLNPKIESIRSPFSIRDMDLAVDRLIQAWSGSQKVRVFADYDVDGTTGGALLVWVFRELGLDCDVRQPDRFKDGYGLNVSAVKEAHREGVGLLVTVDCGITSFESAARARELGLDLVIVDHHQVDPSRGLPQALAVVNPQREDCESGLRQLCGCGLAFYLALALRNRAREKGMFQNRAEPQLKQHLDLVVLATAADMVPLTGDNHTLVRHGMDVLRRTRKPGVRALLEAAHLNAETVSPGHLGFVIGPRINASGRMQSASLALELLTTMDPVRAMRLARELEQLNEERAKIQNDIWDQVRVRVEEGLSQGRFQHGIVVGDCSWHEGVVGIVASRVTETFHKPAAVIALKPEGGKGSVRSYGGKNVLQALRDSSEHLLGFGGHKHAAGLSVAPSQLEAFAESFDRALSLVQEDAQSRMLWLEATCEVSDFNLKTIQEIEQMGPFGPGNPEPVFGFRAQMQNQQILKGRHLKVVLGENLNAVEGIWFYAAERKTLPRPGDWGEWAGIPELNRFRGRVTPTIRIKDWRPVTD